MYFPIVTVALLVGFFVTADAAYPARVLNNKEIIRQINNYRRSVGVNPLRENGRLQQSSYLKADDMARHRYLAHSSSGGEPFTANIERVRYRYTHVGEILARYCDSERCILNVWINSPQHRSAMIDPVFRDIGCSSVTVRDGSYVACHLGTTVR